MAKQAVFTSAPRGVHAGTSGYCTVLTTEGLTRALVEFVEKLSVYRIVDTGPDGNKLPPTKDNYEELLSLNPPNYAFVNFNYRRQEVKVLLKTFLAGFDSTGRLRKLSHFLVLDKNDLCPAGPAWLSGQKGIFIGDWAGEPTTLDQEKILPTGDMAPIRCVHWEQVAGDAGWAGKLAESAYLPDKLAVVIFDGRCDPQKLVLESLSLIPFEHRWKATFATNYADFPPNVICNWRFVRAGTSLATTYANRSDIVLIDLTKPLAAAQGSAADSARSVAAIGPPQRMAAPVSVTAEDKTFALTESDVIPDADDEIQFMEDDGDTMTTPASNGDKSASVRSSERTVSAVPVADLVDEEPTQSAEPAEPMTSSAVPPPPPAPRPAPPPPKQQQSSSSKSLLFLLGGAIGFFSIIGSGIVIAAIVNKQAQNQNNEMASLENNSAQAKMTGQSQVTSSEVNSTVENKNGNQDWRGEQHDTSDTTPQSPKQILKTHRAHAKNQAEAAKDSALQAEKAVTAARAAADRAVAANNFAQQAEVASEVASEIAKQAEVAAESVTAAETHEVAANGAAQKARKAAKDSAEAANEGNALECVEIAMAAAQIAASEANSADEAADRANAAAETAEKAVERVRTARADAAAKATADEEKKAKAGKDTMPQVENESGADAPITEKGKTKGAENETTIGTIKDEKAVRTYTFTKEQPRPWTIGSITKEATLVEVKKIKATGKHKFGLKLPDRDEIHIRDENEFSQDCQDHVLDLIEKLEKEHPESE